MNSFHKLVFLVLALFCSQTAMAQPDLPDDEVEVIKDFEARLADSEKLELSPELPLADTTSKHLTYQVPVKSLQVDYPAPKIRPLAIPAKKEAPGFNGYLKAGYGSPNSPLGELFYSYSNPEKYIIGLNARHHSANSKKLEHQRFSDTDVNLNGLYYFESGLAVGARIGYHAEQVHFYGYDHEVTDLIRSEVKQKFNTIYGNVNIFNAHRTQGDINYRANAGFYRLTDNYTVSELGINLSAGATKWFMEKHAFNVDVIADFTNPDQILSNDLNNFYIQPNFAFHADKFRIKAGVNLAFSDTDFYIYPDAEVAVNIIGNKLAAYVGAGGDLKKNTIQTLSNVNPYIHTRDRLTAKNTSFYHYYGGVKGNLQVVDYQIEGGFKRANDLALYLTDPTDTLRFAVLYDTVNIVTLNGSLTATPVKNLELTVTLGQSIFNPENEEKAWHLPIFNTNFSARYTTLGDKLTLKGELFIENGVPYRDNQGNVGNLNGLFDLNVGAEYSIGKNIGIFLDLNNIASNKRQRWFRYPTYGFNVMGGVTARF